jgi:ArgP family transcriptional regulator
MVLGSATKIRKTASAISVRILHTRRSGGIVIRHEISQPKAAVIEHGPFDAAAARLHVTPSAVSQRIKALEQRVGQVLVVREKPCSATLAGVPLLRLAVQTALLEAEELAEMGGGEALSLRIAVAVNADSMATWFTGVFRSWMTYCSTSASRIRTTRRGCCARVW